jgi:DNA modification methylase
MSISSHLLSRLRNIDWDFPASPSESPFSAIHWHPARFASQVPSSLIGLLSKPNELVLDPFMGSGTTLVEAQRLGRRSIGIDLNPIACMMVRAKTLPFPIKRIERAIQRLEEDSQDCLGKPVFGRRWRPKTPDSVQAMWYTRHVLEDLSSLWSMINTYRGIERMLAKATFSAILLPVCRETRHWGYVCDNSTPKGDYERDVLAEYHGVLKRLRSAYEDREIDRIATCGAGAKIPLTRIFCADVGEILAKFSPGSVDLVVTSPPYFGVSDYIKSQRLSMEWLRVDIEPLRLKEIGARSKRHRSSAPDDYIRELGDVFTAVGRCLRKDGICVVIVGESAKRDSLLLRVLGQMLVCGLKQELDVNRRVSSLRRQLPSITSEHLLVMSK